MENPIIDKFQIIPNGQSTTILTGEAPKQIDPYEYEGFAYKAFSTPSFVELVKAKAVRENAIIFAHDGGFSAICDDTLRDRDQDSIRLDFTFSDAVKEWGTVLCEKGKTHAIKQVVDFLKRRNVKEIENLDELLYAFKNFRYVKNIAGDFTYDDRNNYNFAVKINNTESTVRIPALIEANIEIFKSSGFISAIDIEIEVLQPNNPSETPLILLSCPTFQRHYTKAKEVELESLRMSLKDWLIVEGEY